MAKDFSGVNTGRVYESIEKATAKRQQQGTASVQEQEQRKANLQTQGRKGAKSPRLNLILTPENHEFIRVMARATGNSQGKFTNMVLTAYRNEHPEIMEQARAFLDTVNSGTFSRLPAAAGPAAEGGETTEN